MRRTGQPGFKNPGCFRIPVNIHVDDIAEITIRLQPGDLVKARPLNFWVLILRIGDRGLKLIIQFQGS